MPVTTMRFCSSCRGAFSHETFVRGAAQLPHTIGVRGAPLRPPICLGCATRYANDNAYREQDGRHPGLHYFWLEVSSEEPLDA